ncbi:MAG: metallophosphoesterase, partial [Chitinophagaceae bacterium]|nr:metallophosphoesterase [Chitinophagaceae bacterium]
MNLRSFCMLLLLSLTILQASAQDSVQARIVLVGDAGSLKDGRHPVISAIRSMVKMDSLTTVLFLGDNLYTYGLPDDAFSNYSIAAAILDSQINVVKNTSAHAYFIPGNHDWNHEGPDGWNTIMREQNYIDIHGAGNNVEFYPKDGCPGPVQVNLGKDVVMILMDSQWWLHLYDKPGIESDCPYKTKEEVLNQIDDIVSKNSKKLIVFACHHPMKSDGIHGGYYTLKQHLFPLTDMNPRMYIPMPLIGSIYPITRGIFGTPQDLKHPAYQNMINDLEKVLKHHPNVIFAAGHEHNMQLIQDSSYNYIVAGSGTNKTRVSKSRHQLYGAAENGFAVLEVLKNKLVNVTFYEVKDSINSIRKAYTNTILDFSKLPKTDSAVNPSTVTAVSVPFEDSVIVSASEKYTGVTGLKRLVEGDNYRKEWSAKVKLKVFDISKVKGGLTIQSLGGGKQTTSLRMKDKEGREWTLRTIDKNPENAIPEALRGSIAQHIVEDMVSASHPYGALTVPLLASAANVIVAKPEFYFVPDDPAFGIYRSRVANTVCMLEEREPTPDKDTKSTQKVMSKILDDNDNRIDQPQVLRARLLDMLIGDWDRHLDQWRWATRDTGKGKLYYAVPRDRDQVFFNSDGLLVKIVSSKLFRYLKGFSSEIRDVNWFNWEERDIDRFFLNRLDKQRWTNIIDSFRMGMTDSVIVAAVNQMPPEIVAIDGNEIIGKLKGRRDDLAVKGLQYYKFLARTVTVLGTNDKEYFKVTTDNDTLNVKVYKRSKNSGELSSLMYERKFDPADTK